MDRFMIPVVVWIAFGVVFLFVVGAIIYYAMKDVGINAKPDVSGHIYEMLATKEGREKLAELAAKQFPTGKPESLPQACEKCNGFGKLGWHIVDWEGGPAEALGKDMCPDCGGTGLKGGAKDYMNVNCATCGGKGHLGMDPSLNMPNGPKCGDCKGTGVVRVKKVVEEKGETVENG